MDEDRSWLDDLGALNAIALAWYTTITGNAPPSPATPGGVNVSTPIGSASVSPMSLLLLTGLGVVVVVLLLKR